MMRRVAVGDDVLDLRNDAAGEIGPLKFDWPKEPNKKNKLEGTVFWLPPKISRRNSLIGYGIPERYSLISTSARRRNQQTGKIVPVPLMP